MFVHPQARVLESAFARCLSSYKPFSGLAYRACAVAYANRDDLLTGAGSKANGGRWNQRGQFRTVYLSLSIEIAIQELIGQFQSYGFDVSKKLPFVVAGVEVTISKVVDLTDAAIRRSMGISKDSIIKDNWKRTDENGIESLTQCFGRLAYEAELDGIIAPSAIQKSGKNLIVFPGNLVSPHSFMKVVNREHLPKV